jgi:hypothetical protein
MSATGARLQMPPRLFNARGYERRVGIELEMSGLKLDALAAIVARHLQLNTEVTSRYERTLKGDPAGDWIIELDFDLLKKMGRGLRVEDEFMSDLEDTAELLLFWGAERVVPLEVIGPPLPLSRLEEVENLVVVLRAHGALGTAGNLLYAFSMQFNPELPAEDVDTVLAYLRAFLCLYDWLHKRAEVNFTRRLTAYVDPFPKAYVRRLMASSYRPNMTQLMDDYLKDNHTRNRALDMLPLFAHIDERRVRRAADDPLIKARPTFHYRLPNCEIDRPGWGIHKAWNDWVEVERLAEDKSRLERCCKAYAAYLDTPVHLPGQWYREICDKWLR